MKYPTRPSKPNAPYKPLPPEKKIEQKIKLGTESYQEDNQFTIASLIDNIKSAFPTADPNKVKFSFEIDTEYGYYDDVSTHLNIHYFTIEMIDDPNFDKLWAHYQKRLSTYKSDYKKYKQKLKTYKEAENKYKKEIELWQVERAKAIVAKHENKTKKVKGK